MNDNTQETSSQDSQPQGQPDLNIGTHYLIRFRERSQIYSAVSRIQNLRRGEVVMTQTDHGLEPASIQGFRSLAVEDDETKPKASYTVIRRGTREEIEKYERLVGREQEAYDLCNQYIRKHQLPMKLIHVERFFNGSKIIFYFTAESRVDFRELVKDLVQEFRTRVEMRQIGVRHETKMIGGIGCCGRELCCASFIKNFAPVSIKMAKEQDLPLNPAKISGICNRLLCCLTYEYKTYRAIKKHLPKPGKQIVLDGKNYKILHINALQETITVVDPNTHDPPRILTREEWEPAVTESVKKRGKRPRKSPKDSNT